MTNTERHICLTGGEEVALSWRCVLLLSSACRGDNDYNEWNSHHRSILSLSQTPPNNFPIIFLWSSHNILTTMFSIDELIEFISLTAGLTDVIKHTCAVLRCHRFAAVVSANNQSENRETAEWTCVCADRTLLLLLLENCETPCSDQTQQTLSSERGQSITAHPLHYAALANHRQAHIPGITL